MKLEAPHSELIEVLHDLKLYMEHFGSREFVKGKIMLVLQRILELYVYMWLCSLYRFTFAESENTIVRSINISLVEPVHTSESVMGKYNLMC